VDVKAAYGAVGNGTTDDTAAIIAARDSGAAIVWFPPGTYKTDDIVWDKEVQIWGPGSRFVSIKPTGSGIGLIIRPASAASKTQIKGITLDGALNTQASTKCGVLVQRKVYGEDFVVKNFNGTGIKKAPYDASTTDGSGGTVGNAVFFCLWTNCHSTDNGADGWDVRMGANCNGFINCQAVRNKGENWRHRTDGGATYGNWWVGGQGSYGSKNGWSFEGGSDVRTFALYTEYNHSPTNTNTDGYTGSSVDINVTASSRSLIDTGVLLNADSAHVKAPASGSDDSCLVTAAGRRFFNSTGYMTGHRVTGPAASTASDLATLKADYNALLSALRSGGHIS
jgi:hypothetical protein